MADEMINLIIRINDDESVYATSPQAPGLMIGRSSLAELRGEVPDALAFHFNRPGPFRVAEHLEQHYDVADGELVVRTANDTRYREREEVNRRVHAALRVPGQAEQLVSGPHNVVGETVYVCAVASDTVRWVVEQLDSRGDVVVAALAIGDVMMFSLPIAYGEEYRDDPEFEGAASGPAGMETTLGEIMRQTPIVSPLATGRARGLVYC